MSINKRNGTLWYKNGSSQILKNIKINNEVSVMLKKNSQIDRMLNQPIAQEILGFLAKEDLSIVQISEKLQNINIQKIIAYIAELQRLGLVIPSSNEFTKVKTNEIENNIEKSGEILQVSRHEWFSPLGLALPEYNALWEETSKKKGKSSPKILDNLIFTIPDTLKEYFKKDNPDSP